MNGRSGVHGSGLVHAPSAGACTAGMVTSAEVTLVQVSTGCSSASGIVEIFANRGSGISVGSCTSAAWLLVRRLCR